MKVAWEKGDKIFSYYSYTEQEYTQDGEMTQDGKFASFTKTSGTLKAGKTYVFSYPKVMGTSSSNGSFVLQRADRCNRGNEEPRHPHRQGDRGERREHSRDFILQKGGVDEDFRSGLR